MTPGQRMPRPVRPVLPVDEVERSCQKLLVHGLHALGVERARVFDPAVRRGLEHSARPEAPAKFGFLRIVRVLRLFLGIEVVEVAEKLVEAVIGRQELVLVPEVVLAELSCGVAKRFEQLGDSRVLRSNADIRAWQPDFRKARADRRLSRDEGGAPCSAALLAVPVGEHRAFVTDAIDVRRAVTHDAAVVYARIEPADVVAHDHQDVRLASRRRRGGLLRLLSLRLRRQAGRHQR